MWMKICLKWFFSSRIKIVWRKKKVVYNVECFWGVKWDGKGKSKLDWII